MKLIGVAVLLALVALEVSDAKKGLFERNGKAPLKKPPKSRGAPWKKAQAAEKEYILVFDMSEPDCEEQIAELEEKVGQRGGEIEEAENPRDYQIGDFRAVRITVNNPNLVDKLQHVSCLAYIEQSSVITASACSSQDATNVWGLDWLSQAAGQTKQLDKVYSHDPNGGDGITVYVLDTGIRTTHSEFENRASWGTKFCQGLGCGPNDKWDKNGHGTHCAGTAAGKNYGVAKKAKLVAVKILDDCGSGIGFDTIDGIQWVINRNHSVGKAVINLSVGGQKEDATNAAVEAAVAKGIVVAAAAGNENADACNTSPASAPNAITVGAHDNKGARASFSNWGTCLDVFAPGVDILSAQPHNDTSTVKNEGTSMSCPHVVGVAAVYLSQNVGHSPAQFRTWMLDKAQTGVTGKKPTDPDKMLTLPCP